MAVIYGVSQVTAYLRELLAYDDVLADIWIEGEVANLRRPGSGHAYFTLRDSQSSLRGVLFRNSRGLENLQDGAAVVAHGRVSLYEVRGDLQLIADIVQPEGVGELQMRLEQLQLQLEREGLFDPSRKRPLPEVPRAHRGRDFADRLGLARHSERRRTDDGRWWNCSWPPRWSRETERLRQ